MSQDAWIGAVQAEVEESAEFRTLRDMISEELASGLGGPRPAWWDDVWSRLAAMGNGKRIAEEAGRRYQRALTEWRYRQG